MSSVSGASPDVSALLRLVSPLLSSLLLGSLFTYGLQGILIIQVYHYYLSFPRDEIFWKILVYVVLFVECLQTALTSIDAFHLFSSGWGKFELLNDLNLLFMLPITSGCLGLVCHSVFAYRIYFLSHSLLVCTVVGSLALFACASGIAFGVKLYISRSLTGVAHMKNIYLLCGLWNGSAAVCDAAIAALMTFYLSRSSTGYKSTDVLLARIIRLTIETGLFTATASLASSILFSGYRANFRVSIWFIVPAILLSKLYAVTTLAMFNNRAQGSVRAVGDPTIQTFESRHPEIQIGRSVVRQVWTDDSASVTHLQTFSGDSSSNGRRSETQTIEKKSSISKI